MIQRISRVFLLFVLLATSMTLVLAGPSTSYNVQTVLLVGSTEGESDLTGVPANVIEALGDATRFLPYKYCRLIDASILRSSGEARGLLSGPDGKDFELSFSFHPTDDPDTLMVRSFGIDTLVAEPRDRVIMEDGKHRIEHSPPRWVRRNVISTSFTVKVGETIVVGTSKLNGNGEALIVLFTAMR